MAFSSNPIGNPEEYKMLPDKLSPAGSFSYCTLCAIALHELYDNEWDKSFREHCIDVIIAHLKLDKSVRPTMQVYLSGEALSTDEFRHCLKVLKSEEIIASDCSALLHDLVLVAVKDGTYDARWRVLVQYFADKLGIPRDTLDQYEMSAIHHLTTVQHQTSEADKQIEQSKKKVARYKKMAIIGMASVGGGALIGLTGGLAAPFIGAGIMSLGLGSVVGGGAALLSTSAGIAVVASLFGAAGAGLTGFKMHKRVGDIEEFEFNRLLLDQTDNNNEPDLDATLNNQQLHVSILISGWLKDESADNYIRPWLCARTSQEQYYLRYESRYLLAFGRALEYILSMAFSIATNQALKYTALSTLLSAIAWPSAMLGLANMIDNPWGVCCRRSAQVGKQLAEVLLQRQQGQRPVTLIGFSIGARVIYYCLREMAERDNCEGIIQDAIMIGAPVASNPDIWRSFTRVVAGRLVNGYCKSDWLLKFLYRTFSMPSHGVAGLHPIELEDRRMCNVDLSDIVSGHVEYSEKICVILRTMNIRVKEGPCGEVRIPRSQTIDIISKEKAVSPTLRKTQSDNGLSAQVTFRQDDDSSGKEDDS